jgi:uracil-DNA glycosylase
MRASFIFPLVHHAIYVSERNVFTHIALAHPGEKVEFSMKQIVMLDIQSQFVQAPIPYQATFKYEIEGRLIENITENNKEYSILVNQLSLLPWPVLANLIVQLQTIVPDDISLLNAFQKLIQYPSNYFQVDCDNPQSGLSGLGFYPVGRGLWEEQDRSLKKKRIMVLGQDFGGHEGYTKSIADGMESVNGPTWRNLLELLKDSNVDLADVFFTNAVMGQRQKGLSSVKNDAWVKENEFLQDNLDFLKLQILVQRPEVILVLGKEAFPILKQLHPVLEELRTDLSFEKLDSPRFVKQFNQEITLAGIPDYSFRLVFLVHPSYRHVNVAKRHYKNSSGKDAENQMVLEALIPKVQMKEGSIIKTSELYLQENQNSKLSEGVLNPIFKSFEAQLNQLREQWFNYENAEKDLFNQNESTYCGMWVQAMRESFPPCVPILEVAVYDADEMSIGRIDCLAQIILDGQTTNFIIEAKQWPYDGKEDDPQFNETEKLFKRISDQANAYYEAEKEYYSNYPTYLMTVVFEYLSKPEYVQEMQKSDNWDPYTHYFKLFHTGACGMMVYGNISRCD